MLFVIIPFSLALLGVIVYIALSRKSSKALRLAALGALGAIILSVLICLVIIFASMGVTGREPVMPDFLTTEPLPDAPKGNFFVLFPLAVFIIAFLGVVIFLSLRERKRQQNHSS
jgi:amino acid transporter